jgi:hypothetical protein
MRRKLSPKERLELLQIYFSARTEKGLGSENKLTVATLCRSSGIARNTFLSMEETIQKRRVQGIVRQNAREETIAPENHHP